MTKHKYYRWWIIVSVGFVVYFAVTQFYWYSRVDQINRSPEVKTPSGNFNQAGFLKDVYQVVDADATISDCNGSEHGWPIASVHLRFDSGYALTYSHLALDGCPKTSSSPNVPFRTRVSFWNNQLLILRYGEQNEKSIYSVIDDPYVIYNPKEKIFGFFVLQFFAAFLYYIVFVRIDEN